MDGVQIGMRPRRANSLQYKLSLYLSLTIVVVGLLAGGVSFFSAMNEAHELQDSTLHQIAVLLDHQQAGTSVVHSTMSPQDGGDEETRVTVQWLDGHRHTADPRAGSSDLPLPPDISDGLHTLAVGGEDFRVMVRTTQSGARIAVSQETGMRDEIARDSAMRAVAPVLLLAPLLVVLVTHLIRTLFQPITRLSAEVNGRSEWALHPVDVNEVPVEVRPFLEAINGLLAKVSQALNGQRRFLADAAHELRSPLAALSLQSERLSQAEMSAVALERLQALRQGIERGRSLLEQLLTLARVQTSNAMPQAEVSVLSVYKKVMEDLMPLAEAKHIDMGVIDSVDVSIKVSQTDLFVLIKNLVDNAIRYSPAGGKVDLRVALVATGWVLSVADEGPGIPESERVRVFDPFYRVLGNEQPGSGLGLAIVKEIADRIGASVRLDASNQVTGQGLTVTVHLPTLIAEEIRQA